MTKRNLPLEGTSMEFSADISAGRRPEFLREVNFSKWLCIVFIFETVIKGSKLSSTDNPVFAMLLGTAVHRSTNC